MNHFENCTFCSIPIYCDKLQRCSGCRVDPYCSIECQQEHWPIHKILCKDLMRHPLTKLSKKWLGSQFEGVWPPGFMKVSTDDDKNVTNNVFMITIFSELLVPGTFFEITLATDPSKVAIKIVSDKNGELCEEYGCIPSIILKDEKGFIIHFINYTEPQIFVEDGQHTRQNKLTRKMILRNLTSLLCSFLSKEKKTYNLLEYWTNRATFVDDVIRASKQS